MMLKLSPRIILLALILISTLSACGTNPPATPTILSATPTQEVTASSTPMPESVWLVASLDTVPSALQSAQAALSSLAASSSLVFETRNDLQTSDLHSGLRVVLFLTVPSNLQDLTAAAPATQFVVINAGDLPSSANLTQIRLQPDEQAFMAGYVVELLADDWRAAGLLPAEGILAQVFENGGKYNCGTCAPVRPPYVRFPLMATSSSNSDPATWQTLADQLLANDIRVMYIAPEAASEPLLTYLASRNLILVGGTTPPDSVRSLWAATIQQDPYVVLTTIWDSLLAGQGGQVVPASLSITDLNPQLFPPGRQRLAQEVIDSLTTGLILTTDP